MNQNAVENISEVIAYVESHLHEKLDLETVADAVHYSKYYLHRMFADTVGMTLHDYVQRRQLTEAAKLLVFSEKTILEIALTAGYESQRAFASAFKSMYKQTPARYRENRNFYPLQLEFVLNKKSSVQESVAWNIVYASKEDIPGWMKLVTLVIDGFPGFEKVQYLEQLRDHIARRQALLIRDVDTVIGAAAFSYQTGSIDFLGVHPQYRKLGVAKAFLDFIMEHVFRDREISITTFREGDKADTGQRAEYMRLGFAEAELLTEYGYPTQRLTLQPETGGEKFTWRESDE